MPRSLLLLRLSIVLTATLACLEPRPFPGTPFRAPVEVWDVSASMGSATPVPPASLRAGTPRLAVADGQRWMDGDTLPTLGREGSTLGAALAEVSARHAGRRVLLVSDGRATDDAQAGARAIRAAGGWLDVRPPERPAADVALLAARGERSGGRAEVRVTLGSSTPGVVRVGLWDGNDVLDVVEVRLDPGALQMLALTDPVERTAAVSLQVRLEPLPGTPNDDRGNDALVVGVPTERGRVLWWGPAPTGLATLLPETTDLVVFDPALARTSLREALDLADVVVLADLPLAELSPSGVDDLSAFVAGGGRLLVLGGPDAYGAGGYAASEFEERLLPLRVPRTASGADWVVALDVSGSTRGAAHEALKEAVREALAELRPGERLAVLPFAGVAAVAPLAPGFVTGGGEGGAQQLVAALDAIQAGGATDLVLGLEGGLRLLESSPRSRERRLLLLTDGDPDDAPDVPGLQRLAPRLAAQQVRFGAVVVDMPAAARALAQALARAPDDVRLLASSRDAAAWLRRSMRVQRASSEAERMSRPIRLEPRPDTWADASFEGWVPRRVNEVELHPDARAFAHVRLEGPAERELPFAAERTRGAGQVCALAWGPAFEPDVEAGARRLIPLLVRLAAEADRGAPAEFDEQGRLTVRFVAARGQARLQLLAQSDEKVLAELLQVAPALFRSAGAVADAGPLRVRSASPTGVLERTLRLPQRPPPEHRGAGPDVAALAALAQAGGGRVLTAGGAPVAEPRPGPSWSSALLVAAGMLLIAERWRASVLRRRGRSVLVANVGTEERA